VLLTVNEAAALMACSERRVYRWVEAAEIPFRRIRDQIRFDRAELLDWAMDGRHPVSIEAIDRRLEFDERTPSLEQALRAGKVHRDVPSNGRESTIRAIVERTVLPASLAPAFVVAVMVARERTLWTAIGNGIAIPQVRQPIIAAGLPVTVSVSYLEQPLLFGAPDGKPIQVIFQIISPTIGEHLRVLAHLSRALLDPGFCAVIERRGSNEDLAMAAHPLQRADSADAITSSQRG